MFRFMTPAFAKTPLGKQLGDNYTISEPLAPLDALKLVLEDAAHDAKSPSPTLDKVVWSATLPTINTSSEIMSEYAVTINAPDAQPVHRRVVGTTNVFPPTDQSGLWYVFVQLRQRPG